ncbi:elongator complex protein 3 [Desulfogranum mediterraneum]|uniref:elongator complex protein 3 n=1 Tax=Desulfogranum mediterraneum TaxID=160661 RepID=UPI00041AA6CE|nr:radical SAM protein [Desulfogranum mediterraneum]
MPYIIPIFIAHEGCPHSCIFCDQHSISGRSRQEVSAEEVALTIEEWLQRRPGRRDQVQVAFYGGSFTALPRARQQQLLGAVAPFLAQGLVDGVRVSTRPDCIDQECLELLADHGVRVVELGVQSLDEAVLKGAGRGHGAEDVAEAVGLLRGYPFQLGLQLMLGLPGQSFGSLRRTMARVVGLAPEMVRIYPVLVIAGSGLERAFRQGRFVPLSLGKAVLQARYMKKQCDRNGIRVIRMGLQPGPSLEDSLVAGPYHPAFGELVLAREMLQQTRRLLAQGQGRAGEAEEEQHLVIHSKDQSIFRGLRSANIQRLSELGLLASFSLGCDDRLPRYQVRRAALPGEA